MLIGFIEFSGVTTLKFAFNIASSSPLNSSGLRKSKQVPIRKSFAYASLSDADCARKIDVPLRQKMIAIRPEITWRWFMDVSLRWLPVYGRVENFDIKSSKSGILEQNMAAHNSNIERPKPDEFSGGFAK